MGQKTVSFLALRAFDALSHAHPRWIGATASVTLIVVEKLIDQVAKEADSFFSHPNAYQSLLLFAFALGVAFVVSKVIAYAIVKVAQLVAVRSDNTDDAERQVRLRRVETYLSVSIALVRVAVIGIVAYYLWRFLGQNSDNTTAAIGASTLFVVLAGGTIGMLLRDITSGAAMIVERWFSVGDYVRIEPFADLAGVVERVTLRSTKLRSLNGEVVWLHNQHIQGVRVTPRGVRTTAVDIFVNNSRVGRTLIEKAIATVPTGTLKVIEKPTINREEQWGDKLFLFTVVGQAAPGREWLMENYFIQSLQELDERRQGPKTLVRPPISRHADAAAERSFKRAVRMGKEK